MIDNKKPPVPKNNTVTTVQNGNFLGVPDSQKNKGSSSGSRG
jgi:hypothetical protein